MRGNVNNYCSQTFIDHFSWKKHVKLKHGNRTTRYLCSSCDCIFSSINSIASHFIHCKDEELIPPTAHPFQCNLCDFGCTTKTGLGVHRRRRHPVEHEREKVITRKHVVWTDEDLNVLAHHELSLPAGTRFINQALSVLFPGRSIESIKGARNKNRKYKDILASLSCRTCWIC